MLNQYQNLNLDKAGLLCVATFGNYHVIVNREQLRRECAKKFVVVHNDKNIIADIHDAKHKAIFPALAKGCHSRTR